VLWFEGAIANYGAPTVVFDLYLLVRDIDSAAEVLFQHGWVSAPERPADYFHFSSEESAKPQHRLAVPAPPQESPGLASTRTFLLAADWNFPVHYLDPSPSRKFIPPLPVLVDALIGSLLDAAEDTELYSHLQMQVGYFYGHVPELKVMGFADNLSYEHRQFHLDSLLGMFIMSLSFIAHERQIRVASQALLTHCVKLLKSSRKIRKWHEEKIRRALDASAIVRSLLRPLNRRYTRKRPINARSILLQDNIWM